MTMRCNVIRHGHEQAAEHVKCVILRSRGVQTLVVRPNGAMRMYGSDRVSEEDRPYIVGAYTKTVLIEEIEDDLIFRLRELSK